MSFVVPAKEQQLVDLPVGELPWYIIDPELARVTE
jgi:hypothetical protein